MRVVLATLVAATRSAYSGAQVMADEQLASLPASDMRLAMTPKPAAQLALVCFGAGVQISGMNKICYYNWAGSVAAITISSVKLCPLTINQ